MSDEGRRPPTIAIVGAGFGGLTAAIELQRAGYDDVVIFERADDVGGVWRENTYPGAACDVPSPLYSLSYEPSSEWPRRYSAQPDIHDYLRRIAERQGLLRKIRFRTEVCGADFDGRWRLRLSDGSTVAADVLVPAVGQLSRPAYPAIVGMADFAGPSFHSARWDHDLDLTGKRIAVVGTGASAVQFVPRIAPVAQRLTIFQRTPPWVLPKPDRAYTRAHHALFRHVPAAQRAGRAGTWLVGEAMTRGVTRDGAIRALMAGMCRAHLRLAVRDKQLRARLTPDYPVGCKRVLFSNDYLPTLSRPDVDVITEKITAIVPSGVRAEDGTIHDVDVIIYGTGFAATDLLAPMQITGRDGRRLDDVWAGGPRAYLGMTVAGFPNLAIMYGPNTNLGGNSIIYMLEHQARYVRQLVDHIARVGPVEVRADVADRFDAEMRARLDDGAWTQCANWYRSADGHVTTNWPGQVFEYHRRTARLDIADYRTVNETERRWQHATTTS